jgi:hypothetical protein
MTRLGQQALAHSRAGGARRSQPVAIRHQVKDQGSACVSALFWNGGGGDG